MTDDGPIGWFEATARWYGVLLLLTLGWAPLIRLLCPRLADRGAGIARPLAILGLVYPTWLLASLDLLPYSTVGLWVTLAVGSVVGWWLVIRRRLVDRRWLRGLLAAEAVSLLTFAGYVWLRGYNPELVGTEKPMDSAFLASSALATAMPPPDPWFAGEPINYYYFGYLLHGALARLADIPPTTGFNLALATTFAAAATAAIGLGFDAARPWLSRRRAIVGGALAAVLLVGVGNLYAAWRFVQAPRETIDAWWWDQRLGIGWRASRIVCDGARVNNDCPDRSESINEFPFFSFLLGDLHPHVMALPYTVVALTLALNLLLLRRSAAVHLSRGAWVAVGVTGAAVGSLYAMNSWDFPTYLLVAAIGLWVGMRALEGRARLRAVAVLVAASVVPWLPFIAAFAPPTGGDAARLPAFVRDLPVIPRLLTTIGVHDGERTSVGEFLTMFGVAYLLALWLIGSGIWRERARGESFVVSRGAVATGVLVLAVAVLLPAPLVALCGVPLAGAVLLLRRDGRPSVRGIATALFALGLALCLVVELFYIQDAFGRRMNTLFKVYYQVWTLFAVAAALTCLVVWREARPRLAARPALFGFAALALISGGVYPVLATRQWISISKIPGWDGPDGIAYARVEAPDELAALRWLQANAGADDVVLEAAGCSYQPNGELPFGRAAAYTGVPTIINWGNNHQTQWRSGQPDLIAAINPREADVARLFAEPRGELLDRYGVTLLYVGRFEREDWRHLCDVAGPYPAVRSPSYPGAGWELAFEQGEVSIYRREPATAAQHDEPE